MNYKDYGIGERENKFRVWDSIGTIHHMRDWEKLKEIVLSKDLDDGLEVIETGSNWTVMQYTGLKDKQGKEIYEGDIVKYTEEKGIFMLKTGDVALVRWINELSMYNLFFENEGELVADIGLHTEDVGRSTVSNYDIEVIGNCFENPNLLEK